MEIKRCRLYRVYLYSLVLFSVICYTFTEKLKFDIGRTETPKWITSNKKKNYIRRYGSIK